MTAPVGNGRETTFVPVVATDLVVPESLKPGDRVPYTSFDEYKTAKVASVKPPKQGMFSYGDSEGDKAQARRETADQVDQTRGSGEWRNDNSVKKKVTAKDAQKFEEKRGNISAAQATTVAVQNSSLNALRQNAQDSIRMGQYLV